MTSVENFARLDRYLRKQIDTVSGYLIPIDALAISALGKFQTGKGIRGGLCEFGVHHGRLFFILAHLRRHGEKVLACDLFEDGAGNDNRIHRGRATAIFRNIKRLGIDIADDEILIGNTLELKPENITSRIGNPRLVSVDAGHLYNEVANDLALSAAILAPEGVIIADDYFNLYWPDVTTATNAFLENSDGAFAPFLITPGKLYICRSEYLPVYREYLQQLTASPSVRSRSAELNKRTITAIRLSRRGEWQHRLRGMLPGRGKNSI